jgi:hypothetical protein
MKILTLPPWASSCPHILAPTTREQCESNFFYENVDNLVRYIATFQTDDDVIRTLGLLKNLCQVTADPIKDRPFVVVVGCAYINAMTMAERHKIKGFAALFQVLHSVCGAPSRILRPGDTKYAWEGIRFALEYIRSYQVRVEPAQPLDDSQHGRLGVDGFEDLHAASVFTSLAASDIV